jgi:hypothetical protein
MSKYCRKLTDEQRIYIIKRLAARHGPMAVMRGLKDDFGVTLSQHAVDHYDAERAPHSKRAQRWTDLFWREREAYLARTAHLGKTDKAARIRQREAMMHREWAAGRHAVANAILDSIAKELGATFGRKRRR